MDKWEVPDYIFNGKIYPPFLSGSGYVMSRDTASCLYANGIEIPYFHLEVTYMMLKVKEGLNMYSLYGMLMQIR